MQPWLLYAAVSGIASNAQNYFARLSLRHKGDALAYAWYFEVIRTIFAFIFLKHNYRLVLSTQSFLTLATLGLVEFVSIMFFVKMHSYAELSLSAIIGRSRLIWVAILSYFLFAEVLTGGAYLGIGLVFIGMAVTSAPTKLFFDKGIQYSFFFSLAAAFVAIAIKSASPYASETITIIGMSIPAILLLPFMRKNSLQRIKNDIHINISSKLMGGFLSFACVFIYAYAVTVGPVSKIAAVYQATMIVSVLMGIFLLGEKENIGRKIFGAVITIIGVVILQMF